MTEMKYLRIFENALRRLGLSKKDVKQRCGRHPDERRKRVPILGKGTKRFIEVDTKDTVGDLILRLTGAKEPPTSFRGSALGGQTSVHYYISDEMWRSPIPANVLYPEGSDYT